jgi:para-aminobenzoate synthetase component 1
LIESQLTIEEIYSRLSGEDDFVFLDSNNDDSRLSQYSLMAIDADMCFISKGSECQIVSGKKITRVIGDPLVLLDSIFKERSVEAMGQEIFNGGAIGYFAYDLGRSIEKLPETSVDDRDMPDIFLNFYHGAIVINHLDGTMRYSDYDLDSKAAERYRAIMRILNKGKVAVVHPFRLKGELKMNMSYKEYLAKVSRIREYIRAGDIYQANMTLRYSAPFEGDPSELYSRLRKRNPAPFSAYLKLGQWRILSSSPERFIEVRNRKISTRPIKGTVARGATPEEDAVNRKILEDSEKDHAELLMIVDLERNDLGHVAKIGSVSVPELFEIETYKTVFHLVSTVEAILKDEVTLGELLRAVFPGGSITGAPKIRAMEIIDELEPTRRNVYTGSVGYIDLSGDLDLNIVIRTIITNSQKVDYQVGGGIVWDSVEESEFIETQHKGRALREVLEHE